MINKRNQAIPRQQVQQQINSLPW